jgi:cytochrome c551/c552
MRYSAPLFASTLPWFFAACGGGQPPAATPEPAPAATEPAPASETPSADPVAAPAAWSEALTREQKVAFMKTHVVPKMGPIFQAMNSEIYKDFGCKTCHGPEFKDHPPEFLPALAFKDGKLVTDKPEVAKFMGEKVVPEMAAIMGMPPYNPETKQGFGCGACHQIKM